MMPPTRIIDVLAEVFRTHGFDTTAPAHPEDQTGQPHRVDLLAEKDGLDVIVATTSGTPEHLRASLNAHARTRAAVGAQYALVVATQETPDSVRQLADHHEVIVWDSDQLASAIGRAVLLEVNNTQDPPIADLLSLAPLGDLGLETSPIVHAPGHPMETPIPPQEPVTEPVESVDPLPFADMMPETEAASPAPPQEVMETAPPAATNTIETGRGWYMETRNSGPPAVQPPAQTPAAAPPTTVPLTAPAARIGIPSHSGADPHTFTPTEGALVAPGVDKENATKTARTEIFTIDDTRLRYHPKRLIHWQVEAFVEGQVKTHLLQGTCLIDLATKKLEVPEQWNSPRHLREGTFDVPVDHKPVRMDTVAAHELVMAHVLEETAREATMQDDDKAGDYALTVKRRVRVQKEDVKIDDQGLHWCPIWWISGKNGDMEIDGLTGTVREKRLQSVPSETILL